MGKQKHPNSVYESEVSRGEKWSCPNIQYGHWNPTFQSILKLNGNAWDIKTLVIVAQASGLEVQWLIRGEVTELKS